MKITSSNLHNLAFYLLAYVISIRFIINYELAIGNINAVPIVAKLFQVVATAILLANYISYFFKNNFKRRYGYLNLSFIFFITIILTIIFLNHGYLELLLHKQANEITKNNLDMVLDITMFFLIGLYLKNIEKYYKIILFLYCFMVLYVIYHIDPNIYMVDLLSFNYNPENRGKYLFLGDVFAIWSVLALIVIGRTLSVKILIFCVSSLCLFALGSRAALYVFLLLLPVLIFKNFGLKNVLILTISAIIIMLLAERYIDAEILSSNYVSRMIGIVTTGEDLSLDMRSNALNAGLEAIKDNWFMGDYAGHSFSNDLYIHNYLSLWRQFGIVPFLLVMVFIIVTIGFVVMWFFSLRKEENTDKDFLAYLSIILLLEIMAARAFGSGYIFICYGMVLQLYRSSNEIYFPFKITKKNRFFHNYQS